MTCIIDKYSVLYLCTSKCTKFDISNFHSNLVQRPRSPDWPHLTHLWLANLHEPNEGQDNRIVLDIKKDGMRIFWREILVDGKKIQVSIFSLRNYWLVT